MQDTLWRAAIVVFASCSLAHGQWIENPANGLRYRLSAPGTALFAEDQAIADGGHLVTIDDPEEQDFLTAAFPTAESLWIGLVQDVDDPSCAPGCDPDGGWRWIDGSPSTFRNWAPSEPNEDTRGSPSENYAVMNCAVRTPRRTRTRRAATARAREVRETRRRLVGRGRDGEAHRFNFADGE